VATNLMMRFFTRILNLFFFPATEWTKIAEENNSRKTVYLQFVLPFMCLMTIATIIGTWLNASREMYTFGYAVYKIAILWASISSGLFFSAFVVTEIMAQHLSVRSHNRDFTLMAYSSGAAYLVIIIVGLFPFFNEFLALAFYSCYMYWQGIQYIIQVEDKQKIIYGLLSYIIMVLTYSLTYFFFEKILKAILLA